jgi:hypothetical protein
MPVDIVRLDNNKGIVFKCLGEFHGKEFIDALKQVHNDSAFNEIKYALVDETLLDTFNVSSAEIYEIAKQTRRISSLLSKGTVIALVAPTAIGFGLGRVWEAVSCDIGWITKVFRSGDEAIAWIKERMKNEYEIDIKFI